MNIASWLERAGRTHPELPALAVGGSTVGDYGVVARRAAAIAGGLRAKFKLQRGERVAIVSNNHRAYLEALFGIWWGGFVAVPINAKLHPRELAQLVEHAGASVVFVSPELESATTFLDSRTVRAVIAFESRAFSDLRRAGPAQLEPTPHDAIAWLFYTSGTSGRPKGAMLSHRNLATMSLAYLADVDRTSPGDTLLHAAPMSHGSGLYAIPHVARMAVNAVPESGRFDAREIVEIIQKWRNTSLFAAPTMVRRLVEVAHDVDASAIRTIVWGGAPMNVSDVLRAIERFGPRLAQIYGQGESPMTITVLGSADIADRANPRWLEHLGTAGITNSAVEVRVVNAEGVPVTPGDAGEIVVRGDTVMQGYWEDSDATAIALKGGWLQTGDIGSFGEDGYLRLKGRSKELILSGGTNIYPREVEEVLASHPNVQEVAVIGRPDPEWGEVVVAYVAGQVDTEELDQLCLERIARFKRPRDYVVVESIPKNDYGKVLKSELRRIDSTKGGESVEW